MRSRHLLYLVAIVILVAALSSSSLAATELKGFQLASENEFLELYVLPTTAEIALCHKETGDLWFSNPPEREQKETMSRGASKARLASQVILTYYSANQQLQMDSFNDSILHEQYSITPLENGLRVEYQFGKKWNDRDFLPTVISEERFNEAILANVPKASDRKFLRDMYGLFSLEEGYDSGEDYSIMGVDFGTLLGNYGIKVDEPKFRVADKRRLFQEYLVLVKDTMKYDTLGQVKAEEITGVHNTPTLLLKWNVMQWDIDDAVKLVKAAGYRPEDAQLDHTAYNVTPPYADLRQFRVVVEYILEDDQLIVRVPAKELSFPDKVYDFKTEKEVSYPLTSVSVLPYFGAAHQGDEGYLFVPDGSGALIYFNQVNPLAEPYSRTVYGPDHAVLPVREYSANLKEQIYLPVFGMKKNNQAFLAIIEHGDASARIEAMLPGMRDSFNRIWPSFEVRPAARVTMEAEGDLIHLRRLSILMYQARLNKNDIVIRYKFLSGQTSNYAAMARLYQEYLVEQHNLVRLSPGEPLPLIVDVVGSMDHVKPVLGFPSNVVESITTHEQTLTIVDDLLASGIAGIKLRYLGWLEGGIRHVFPSKAPLEGALGTSVSWSKLTQELAKRGVGFYPNVDFMHVHRNQVLDGYLEFRDAPRALSRSSTYVNTFNIATYQPIQTRQVPLLSPARLSSVVDSFLTSYASYQVPGLAVGDLGLSLFSDFRLNSETLVDREMAKEIAREQGKKLAEQQNLMVAGSNAYVLPYAEFLVQTPMYSRSMAILHQTVPFYQMVVSGYMGYAGEPFNLADSGGEFYLLKLLETGAVPYVTVTYEPSSRMKNTDFSYLFATHYGEIKADVLALYDKVNQILGEHWTEQIVDHRILAPNVSQTVYESGLTVVVNYTMEPHRLADGQVVPAVGYVVIPEGGR